MPLTAPSLPPVLPSALSANRTFPPPVLVSSADALSVYPITITPNKYLSLYCQVIFLKNSRNFYCYSQINEPRKWTFLCIWYENRGCRVHEVERLSFRSTWPCVYPSFYGSEPPVSTRITILRVLTSFVPPVHNQGAGSAPNQGHALWKIFLPATGSFFI